VLPIEPYNFYVGIDPGGKGAFGLMNAAGTVVQSSTMPPADDLAGLAAIFKHLVRLPKVAVCIEWPTAFPGSFANNPRDADVFGQHKARLETMAFCHGLDYFKVPPTLWKSRLGLDGKQWEGANARALALYDTYYPEFPTLCRGPRGGLLDGPLDALLIAHLARTRGGEGMRSIADKFGKDSAQSFAFMCGGGRRKRKFRRNLA